MALIEPRTLKGFRDYPPEVAIPRERLMETARKVFRSYGFAPIDTPALEYAEILVGKMDAEAEIQRQLYRFRDHGDRDVALRFDLTVPFARFAAQHIGQLGTPFKRYHLGPVWRGENTQAGRYREFWQCDFDTIGTTSNAADIETALVINDLFEALGIDRFEIRINSRLILNAFLSCRGLESKAVPVLRSLDKLHKIGPENVAIEMVREADLDFDMANLVLKIVQGADPAWKNGQILLWVRQQLLEMSKAVGRSPEELVKGVDQLDDLLKVMKRADVPENRIRIDLSITRGLDYYTGTIYETFLTDLPKIGSVCSGGRYDNLAGLYTKQALPGVGASLGLDRLVAAMEQLNVLPKAATPADVFVVQFAADRLGDYQRLARELRKAGIGTEVFPEAKKIGQQLQYAERRGFRVALIAGPDEFAKGVVKLKDLARREETAVAEGELIPAVRRLLGG